MSQRLIKPGMRHPRTGLAIEPIGYGKRGPIWPVMGAAPDDTDPDDPTFTGEDGDDDDEEDEDESDDDKSKSKKSKDKKKDEDDDEDEDDESPAVRRASRQAAKYRTQLRESERKYEELAARLRKMEDAGKKPEEIEERDRKEREERSRKASDRAAQLELENAFLRSNTVNWADPEDALAVATREGLLEDAQDEDGTVNRKRLGRSLRDLAKRKPYLVKKSTSGQDDEDNADEEKEQGQRPATRTARTANGRRKGSAGTADRAALEKKFPVLRRS